MIRNNPSAKATGLKSIRKMSDGGNRIIDTNTAHFHYYIRLTLACLSALVSVCIIGYAYWMYRFASGSHDVISGVPFNDILQASYEIRINQSLDLFQLSVLLIGALVGLFIVKPSEAVLLFTDKPEILMSLSAITLLILSAIFHKLYISIHFLTCLVNSKHVRKF